MLGLLILRGYYLLHWIQAEFPGFKRDRWRAQEQKAIFITLFGYILWNIDLEYCVELRELRNRVGLPWAWLLELHGWWHLLTAFSASQCMDIVREVHEELRSEKEE